MDTGRIAEDGTVYLNLPDGTERVIGQWAAGDPAAGLAYYRRRYDDLVVEVDLMAKRLKSGAANPDAAQTVVAKVAAAVAEPVFLGDVAALQAKLDALAAAAQARRATLSEEKKAHRAEVQARRDAIADEAAGLADSDAWKVAGQRFRDLLDEWKTLPRFDKAAEQRTWERFAAARSQFDKRRRHHFAELDASRAQAAAIKEDLVRRAEELAGSTDWGATSRTYRDLMAEWKASPRAGRNADDALWARFRAAQDAFFNARNEVTTVRSGEESANLAAKLALLERIEALVPTRDTRAARATLAGYLEQWEQIGFVPRADKPVLDRRLRAVEQQLRTAERDHWRRTDPAARDRAERTVASFQASVDKLQAKLDAAVDERVRADVAKSLESTRALLAAAQAAAADYGA